MKKNYTLILCILLLSLYSVIGVKKFKKNTQKPNIILITVDSLRPDHLGCYGYYRNTSPNIDKLAREGIIFKNVIAQSNWTASSIPSLLTSTYMHTHGVKECKYRLNSSLYTLAEVMRYNGYNCWAGISNQDIVNCIKSTLRGFDSIYVGMNGEEITREAIKYIKENYLNYPFFVWLHYFDTHGPYNIPEDYASIFPSLDLIDVPILSSGFFSDNYYDGRGGIPAFVARGGITNIYYYLSLYDGAIRYVDAQIGYILDTIKNLDLEKNTLFIVTADHGEFLGEHEIYFCHITPLFEEVIKIPLIIKYGKKIRGDKYLQVRSIDIMPSILSLSKIKIPKTCEGVNVFSLRGRIKNFINNYAISENDYGGMFNYAIRTQEWKLLYRDINESEFIPLDSEMVLRKYGFQVVEKQRLKNGEGYSQEVDRVKLNQLIEWLKKEKRPLLWFHKSKTYPKIDGIYERLYLKDLDYCVLLNRDDTYYTVDEIRILLEEVKKIYIEKKIVVFFTTESVVENNGENDKWYLLYRGFMRGPKSQALFNIKEDPGEKDNRIDRNWKIAQLLEKKYQSIVKKSKKLKPREITLDGETKKQLKGLGYLQ